VQSGDETISSRRTFTGDARRLWVYPLGSMTRSAMRSRMIHASLLTLLLLIIGAACQGRGGFAEISDSTERIDVVLASVLPPRGSGWHLSRIHRGSVDLAKLGSVDTQSFAGKVLLSRLPRLNTKEEFLEVVSRQRARDSGDPRYEDILNVEKIVVENGIWVIRFHMKYKDFGAVNLKTGVPYLIVEDYGAVYRHPFHQDVAVNVALSQRSMPDQMDSEFAQLAEAFLISVKFRRESTK
jgi:hypothetical protein